MATFDWTAINAKITAVLNSDEVKKEIYAANAGEISQMAIEAAQEFISVLQGEVDSAGFSAGQMQVLDNWDYGSPAVNTDDGTASITVSSPEATSMSLYEERYGSVDLVDVFSRGHTPSTYVYGEWNGMHIRSSLSLTYSNFIESAIGQFTGYQGNGYTVTQVGLSQAAVSSVYSPHNM